MKPKCDRPVKASSPLTLLCLTPDQHPKATALRSVLELYWYRVDALFTGITVQLENVLNGSIPTHDTLMILCHGSRKDSPVTQFLMDFEGSLLPVDKLRGKVNLSGTRVVNLGCHMGAGGAPEVFLEGGVDAYVGPDKATDQRASLFFAIHLFCLLALGKSLREATTLANDSLPAEKGTKFNYFASETIGDKEIYLPYIYEVESNQAMNADK